MRPDDREWIRRTLGHEPGPVPYNFMLTPPAQRKLEAHYRTDRIVETLALPIRMNGPKSVKPLYALPEQFGPTVTDEFGVVWSTGDRDRGSPIRPALPEPDLSHYRFPDPAAECRFERLGAWCEANRPHYRVLVIGDLWERVTFMRGMENALLDLALNPAFMEALLRGLAHGILQTMRILFDRFEFEGVFLSDDYGTQKALLMSPADWRRFIRPRLAEIYSFAKSRGRIVFHHSCGHVLPIIGDLIDLGLDILHPIQPETMDLLALKREFGRRLTFCGGVRTQDFLPRATPEEIRAEVRRLKRVMGEGGGYILEPGITLQADIPLENLVALIEEARRAD